MADLISPPGGGTELMQERTATAYTEAEQQFSLLVQTRLELLLRGELNALPLLRRYHREPNRLGVPPTPPHIERAALRLPVIEQILAALLRFLHAGTGAAGGPISQSHADGRLIERQTFTTRFPHILIERVDRYDIASRELRETEWCVKRVQNQRRDVRLNRALDVAHLGIELAKAFIK